MLPWWVKPLSALAVTVYVFGAAFAGSRSPVPPKTVPLPRLGLQETNPGPFRPSAHQKRVETDDPIWYEPPAEGELIAALGGPGTTYVIVTWAGLVLSAGPVMSVAVGTA